MTSYKTDNNNLNLAYSLLIPLVKYDAYPLYTTNF